MTGSISRRDLFGAGLGRLARARADAAAAPVAPPRRLLRGRAEPIAAQLIRAVAPRAGDRVLDVGSGAQAVAAARRAGALVTAIDPPAALQALPSDDAEFDLVLSAFGVIHAADMRAVSGEVHRVLRPGGRLGITTWSSAGAMGAILRAARRARGASAGRTRPERWGSYEGLQLALDRFPAFDVADREDVWAFPDEAALWAELGAAFGSPADARRLLAARLERFLSCTAGGVGLTVAWKLVEARRDA